MKWFAPEIHAISALRLITSPATLHAPELLLAEFGNVLRQWAKRGLFSDAEVDALRMDFENRPIRLHPMGPLLQGALRAAQSMDLSVYDAMYVALSLDLGCQLITADERLWRKVEASLPGQVVRVQDVAW